MKKLILVCAAAFLAVACGKSFSVKADIEGFADQVGDSLKLNLMAFDGDTLVTLDSTVTNKNTFSFKGSLEMPTVAVIQTADGMPVRVIFLENDKYVISGRIDSMAITGGSGLNEKHDEFQKNARAIQSEEEYKTYLSTVVEENIGNALGAYVMLMGLAPQMDYAGLTEASQKLEAAGNTSVYAAKVKEMAAKKELTSVGKKFIDFSAPDTTGTVIALSDIAGKGKYVLLDFWASWCTPCRSESPNLVAAYNQFKDNFDIFSVSIDEQMMADYWKEAIVSDGYTWTNVCDLQGWKSPAVDLYYIRSIPANYLIGPDGTIVALNLRGEALTAALAELIGGPSAAQ